MIFHIFSLILGTRHTGWLESFGGFGIRTKKISISVSIYLHTATKSLKMHC